MAATRPHIVLVMTDQQRWDTLGCYGYEHMRTPNLDRLAARGTAFGHAYVQGAMCGPSRCSIVSGQYVHTHGVERNEAWLTAAQPNWIEQLRAAGYHTVNIGKMHTAPLRLPCGFEHRLVVENKNYQVGHHGPSPDDYDLYLMQQRLRRPALTYYQDVPDWPDCLGATEWPLAPDLYPDNFIGRHAEAVVREHDFARPLFLWCGFAGPHDPYDVPAAALAAYDDAELPEPHAAPGELDSKPPPQAQAMAGMEGRRSPAAIWWSRATPERIRRLRRHYYANVTLIDEWVGRLVAALEQRGELEHTVVLFCSDHGDCLGDHHQIYKFSSHYDPVVRVPLVVAGPGVAAQPVRNELVELIDLGPTLLELAGAGALDGAQGRSQVQALRGEAAAERAAVFSEHGQRVMLRTPDWKLVLYLGQTFGELYELREDPHELHNLYDVQAYRQVRGQLAENLMHWYGSTRMRR